MTSRLPGHQVVDDTFLVYAKSVDMITMSRAPTEAMIGHLWDMRKGSGYMEHRYSVCNST